MADPDPHAQAAARGLTKRQLEGRPREKTPGPHTLSTAPTRGWKPGLERACSALPLSPTAPTPSVLHGQQTG